MQSGLHSNGNKYHVSIEQLNDNSLLICQDIKKRLYYWLDSNEKMWMLLMALSIMLAAIHNVVCVTFWETLHLNKDLKYYSVGFCLTMQHEFVIMDPKWRVSGDKEDKKRKKLQRSNICVWKKQTQKDALSAKQQWKGKTQEWCRSRYQPTRQLHTLCLLGFS